MFGRMTCSDLTFNILFCISLSIPNFSFHFTFYPTDLKEAKNWSSNGIKANNNGHQKIADEEQCHSEGKEERGRWGKTTTKGKVYNFIGNRKTNRNPPLKTGTGLEVSSWGLRDSFDG